MAARLGVCFRCCPCHLLLLLLLNPTCKSFLSPAAWRQFLQEKKLVEKAHQLQIVVGDRCLRGGQLAVTVGMDGSGAARRAVLANRLPPLAALLLPVALRCLHPLSWLQSHPGLLMVYSFSAATLE